jgi:hypothetical protein
MKTKCWFAAIGLLLALLAAACADSRGTGSDDNQRGGFYGGIIGGGTRP